MASLSFLLGLLLTTASTAYALAALLARVRRHPALGAHGALQPVSVCKPLCGAEPGLEENLAGLCVQDHPDFEILCGVRDQGDPAIAVVERLRARFPDVALRLVVDSRVHGSNLKVSNLVNLESHARHDWLVIADSDIAVAPDYLRRVTAPLYDDTVGIVTCLYRARPVASFWARLGALYIDTWFEPSARLASALGSASFGFGATIALRRERLAAIGGFWALRDRLADDYWLGDMTRRQGFATVLSDVTVVTQVAESRFAALWSRELRWMRTIRSLNGLGFTFLFVTFTLPMLALGLALAPAPANAAIALVGLVARVALYWRRARLRGVLLAPLRESLLLAEWLIAWLGTRVLWRERVLPVDERLAASRSAYRAATESPHRYRESS